MSKTNTMFLEHLPLPRESLAGSTHQKPLASSSATSSTVATSAGRSPPAAMAVSAGSVRSASIPVPQSHGERTQSQVQLCIDEEAAEQMMFYRLVNGMREKHGKLVREHPLPAHGKCDKSEKERNPPRSRAPQHLDIPSVVDPRYAAAATSTPGKDQASPMLAASHPDAPAWASPGGDEWSITGFPDSPIQDASLYGATGLSPPDIQVTLAPEERECGGEEGIFDLEL